MSKIKKSGVKNTKSEVKKIFSNNRAGFRRRFGSWVIDSLIVIPLLTAAGYLIFGVSKLMLWGGLIALHEDQTLLMWLAEQLWFSLLLGCFLCSYFIWFWCREGQTPGMSRFDIRVQNTDGGLISIGQACVRLGTSAFGLGNFMVIFDRREYLAFQDYWANCEVVVTVPGQIH